MPLPIIPPGLEARATADRTALLAQLDAGGKQADVLASEGRFLQMLHGMLERAKNGIANVINAVLKPSDRLTSPQDWGITRQATSPISTSIDEYDGPSGKGWGCRQEIEIAGVVWYRMEWVENPEGRPLVEWTEVP
ncbi:MAG: hypothetical protein IH997_12040 [Proteobacteria bacterium]|nr:hypothetical protein [Pseudomonadota bacterium]